MLGSPWALEKAGLGMTLTFCGSQGKLLPFPVFGFISKVGMMRMFLPVQNSYHSSPVIL